MDNTNKANNKGFYVNGSNEINNDIIDTNELIMMNNDFYNDDFYDYRDTFINNKTASNSASAAKNNFVLHSSGKATKNVNKNGIYLDEEDFEVDENDNLSNNKKYYANKVIKSNPNYGDYEADEGDEDDEMNSGPLALNFNSKKSTTTTTTSNRNGMNEEVADDEYDLDDNLVSESQFFSKERYEDLIEDNCDLGNYYQDEEENQENMLMMDTFFKRVDSMDLVKPKKAKIVNNYLIGEVLGDGSYGKVKECIEMTNLTRRAVKIINLKTVAKKIPRGVDNVRKEINIMKKLDHVNVIKLYDTFEKGGTSSKPTTNTKNTQSTENISGEVSGAGQPNTMAGLTNLDKPPKLYIFMDYCMTSLEKLFKNAPNQRLCNWQSNYYFKQLIDGLEYLHSLSIIHNDIKPGNLLVTCENTLKICDFSISAEIDPFCEQNYLNNVTSNESLTDNSQYNDYVNPNLLASKGTSSRFPIIQCTPMFQCPEMLQENMNELMILRNATKIDIWSTGITLYQLTTGSLPFQGTTIHQIFENIRSNSHKIQIPKFIDKNLTLLLMGMLNKDPQERWSLKQIRDSEWFKRKHPIVKEELAALPDDVANNESSTFRMINYLEKYCQSANLNNANPSNIVNNDICEPAINIIQQPETLFSDTDAINYSPKSTLNSNQKIKPLKRESKLKKTQCSLM